MKSQCVSVYGLVDPRSEIFFYVGISNNPRLRYLQHLSPTDANQGVVDFVRDIKEAGLLPLLVILEQELSRQKAEEQEQYWIKHYLTLGMPLANKVKLNKPKAQRSRFTETRTVGIEEAQGGNYISLGDASEALEVDQATIQYYIHRLKMQKHRFELDKKRYLSLEDFERIKNLKAGVAERRRNQPASE